jgi:hypothetical protein
MKKKAKSTKNTWVICTIFTREYPKKGRNPPKKNAIIMHYNIIA